MKKEKPPVTYDTRYRSIFLLIQFCTRASSNVYG